MVAKTNRNLNFFATPAHACSYLPDRQAVTLFADPKHPKDIRLYTILSRNGFRRSGEHVYRPHCSRCQACTPVRIPVREFAPKRSQKRVIKRNGDLRVTACPPGIRDEHFELYRRYINQRHRGGGMDNPTREQFLTFLTSAWSQTVFYEFRAKGRLLAVSVTDHLLDGCSAVYTFFEPEENQRSLGVYTILWQISEVARLGRSWLYLGYWIEACRKMRYKQAYRPQEHLVGEAWRRVER